MNCTNCGSPDLVRLALLWERGTTHTQGSAYIGGIGTVGAGGAYASTSTVSRTASAYRAAPPARRSAGGWKIVVFVILIVLAPQLLFVTRHRLSDPGVIFTIVMSLLTFAVLGAIPIWRIRAADKFNATVWPIQMREWGSRYQCNRCGAIGVPQNPSTNAKRIVNVTRAQIGS